MEVRREVLGDEHVDRAEARKDEFTEDFQDFLTRYAWGEVWDRPGLGRRERSVATLAALVALRAENEIAMHVRAALRNGLSRQGDQRGDPPHRCLRGAARCQLPPSRSPKRRSPRAPSRDRVAVPSRPPSMMRR